MLPANVLHLTLLRQFQLPIELRNIVIETYFPFLNNDRSPFLTPEQLLLKMPTNFSKNFHLIPIGKDYYDSDIQRGDEAFSLFVYNEGSSVHAMIGKGYYEIFCWNRIGRLGFRHQEVLYYGNKIVRLKVDISDDNIKENIQKIIRFYHKWVVNAIHGIGSFINMNSRFFHDFNIQALNLRFY